jgi:hypothetical protein
MLEVAEAEATPTPSSIIDAITRVSARGRLGRRGGLRVSILGFRVERSGVKRIGPVIPTMPVGVGFLWGWGGGASTARQRRRGHSVVVWGWGSTSEDPVVRPGPGLCR